MAKKTNLYCGDCRLLSACYAKRMTDRACSAIVTWPNLPETDYTDEAEADVAFGQFKTYARQNDR